MLLLDSLGCNIDLRSITTRAVLSAALAMSQA